MDRSTRCHRSRLSHNPRPALFTAYLETDASVNLEVSQNYGAPVDAERRKFNVIQLEGAC